MHAAEKAHAPLRTFRPFASVLCRRRAEGMDGAGVMQSRWAAGAPERDTEPVLPAPVSTAAEEQALISRCQRGDEAAFRELHRRHRARAVFLAAQLLRDQ